MSDSLSNEWPLYEVFVRGKRGLNHVHVGSLHAADDRMALTHARDLYTRRNEGVSIWVVRSEHIAASSRDPMKAQRIANALADAFVQDQVNGRHAAASQTSQWLQGRVNTLAAQLQAESSRSSPIDVMRSKAQDRRRRRANSMRDAMPFGMV